jgi:ribonuclease HI
MYQLRFDGLFRRIPGTSPAIHAGFMGYGWIIYKNGVIIAVGHGVFARGKNATSGVAEYLALIEGLEALLDLGIKEEAVEIMGDARFVIDQVQGQAAIHSPTIKPMHRKVMRLAANLGNVRWTWTARKHNRLADALTRRAISRLMQEGSSYQDAIKTMHPENKKPSGKFQSLVDMRVYRTTGLQFSF